MEKLKMTSPPGQTEDTKKKKHVCIIGAGPSGLASLRRVLESEFLTGTIFEQKNDIGGVWNYSRGQKSFPVSQKNLAKKVAPAGDGTKASEMNFDPECVTTMYDDLTSNLPYPLMELQDFPHVNPPRTFLTQQEVHSYLRDYANHFKLWPDIQLNTSVTSVLPETHIAPENFGASDRWIVETHNHQADVTETAIYDAVIVCTGKNSYPYQQPPIPGLNTFRGQVLHCKYFQNAESFRDKSVVLIGLGPSSADLALVLSKTARNVTVCHKFGGGFGLGVMPKRVQQTKNVRMVTENGVVTEEDEDISCDVIILCTGYGLKFPFFSEKDTQIRVIEEKYVPNLYKMTVYTKRPSLAILNLCYRSPEFIVAEAQVRYFVAVLEGKIFKLPTYCEMETVVKAEEEEKAAKDWPHSLWFQAGDYGAGAWNYFADLCDDVVGLKQESCWKWPLLESLLLLVFLKRIFGKLALYKADTFRYITETEWEYMCSANEAEFPGIKAERVTMVLDRENETVVTETVEIE